ncbi:MAG: hypothetical protein LBB73_01815 [Dysgonamonadaceae bacterium]|jgi:hypothetical protein|nr:hypothetical protein [Dysgonamonadaceae bacterium]
MINIDDYIAGFSELTGCKNRQPWELTSKLSIWLQERMKLLDGDYIVENVRIGTGCEIKSSIIFSNSAVAHFNFIGDTIVGNSVNFEAGSITANHYNERKDKHICVLCRSERIDTRTVDAASPLSAAAPESGNPVKKKNFSLLRSECLNPHSENLEARSERPKPRSENLEARSERPKPHSENLEARSERPNPRSEGLNSRSERPKPRSENLNPRFY